MLKKNKSETTLNGREICEILPLNVSKSTASGPLIGTALPSESIPIHCTKPKKEKLIVIVLII